MKKSRAPEALSRCAARAEELRSSAAEEVLRFAAGLYRAQAIAAESISGSRSGEALAPASARSARCALRSPTALTGEIEADAGALLSMSTEVLAHLAKVTSAEDLTGGELAAYFRAQRRTSTPRDFLLRAILRPYLQVRAEEQVSSLDATMRRCPFCGGPPWIAARRSAASTDGAARMLCCAWCATEWTVNRILCPSCGETDPAKLPTFSSDASPTARLEACEVCKSYLKSIDLTVDARPIPEVDDLLTLPLDLWAGEQGLTRIEPGLAGC